MTKSPGSGPDRNTSAWWIRFGRRSAAGKSAPDLADAAVRNLTALLVGAALIEHRRAETPPEQSAPVAIVRCDRQCLVPIGHNTGRHQTETCRCGRTHQRVGSAAARNNRGVLAVWLPNQRRAKPSRPQEQRCQRRRPRHGKGDSRPKHVPGLIRSQRTAENTPARL